MKTDEQRRDEFLSDLRELLVKHNAELIIQDSTPWFNYAPTLAVEFVSKWEGDIEVQQGVIFNIGNQYL